MTAAESQNIEYKQGWRDEYLKFIGGCKAANCPVPTFRYSTGEVWTVFHFSEEYQKGVGNSFVSPDDTKDDTKQYSTAPEISSVGSQKGGKGTDDGGKKTDDGE